MVKSLEKLTTVVRSLEKSSGSRDDSTSRFALVSTLSGGTTVANPTGKSVTLTAQELVEIAQSIGRCRNAAKHLRSTVADKLEATAAQLRSVADEETKNLDNIQATVGVILSDATKRQA